MVYDFLGPIWLSSRVIRGPHTDVKRFREFFIENLSFSKLMEANSSYFQLNRVGAEESFHFNRIIFRASRVEKAKTLFKYPGWSGAGETPKMANKGSKGTSVL